MLAIITALPIMMTAIFVLLFIFVILPKIKSSKKIDKLTNDLTIETTKDTLGQFKNAKSGLEKRSKDTAETIEKLSNESQTIDKVLGKD